MKKRLLHQPRRHHPVIIFPHFQQPIPVLDLSKPKGPDEIPLWTIGKYNEHRLGTYNAELFQTSSTETRDVHVGIDLFAPVGVAVHAFDDGRVVASGRNEAQGDYGPVVVCEHPIQVFCEETKQVRVDVVYALYGHLSLETLELSRVNRVVKRGDVLGWIGSPQVNGGWPSPHVHFQLSWMRPKTHDMPGVVSLKNRIEALEMYPDPRPVLGLDEAYRFVHIEEGNYNNEIKRKRGLL